MSASDLCHPPDEGGVDWHPVECRALGKRRGPATGEARPERGPVRGHAYLTTP